MCFALLCQAQHSFHVSPIPHWLQAFEEDPTTLRTQAVHGRTYYALGMFAPEAVPEAWLPDALAQARATTIVDLIAVWERMCIIVPRTDDEPEAQPTRLVETALRKFWSCCALVTRGRSGALKCACPMACSDGHCVHAYAVAERFPTAGEQMDLGFVVPRAADGALNAQA